MRTVTDNIGLYEQDALWVHTYLADPHYRAKVRLIRGVIPDGVRSILDGACGNGRTCPVDAQRPSASTDSLMTTGRPSTERLASELRSPPSPAILHSTAGTASYQLRARLPIAHDCAPPNGAASSPIFLAHEPFSHP